MKSLATSLNNIRSKMLDALRRGKVLIPEQCVHVHDASKDASSFLYQFLAQVFDRWTTPAR